MNTPSFTSYEPAAVDFIYASLALLIFSALLLGLGWWLDSRVALEALSHTAPEPELQPDEAAHLPPFTGTASNTTTTPFPHA